jgi:ABC-type uncharacterized transport system auxiliary subunit
MRVQQKLIGSCSEAEQRRMVVWMEIMRKIVPRIIVSLAALVILTGCSGKVRSPNYYTLNLPVPPAPPLSENAHGTLAVREFRAPVYLHQGAIVYKTSPEQIGFYAYHRWAIDPRDFVTTSLIDRLRVNGVFARVKPYDGSPDADYVLSGRLEKLEELDYQGSVKVEVAVSAQVTNISTGAIVWSNAVSEIADVNQHDVPSVVSEMNLTMQRAIEKLVASLSTDWAVGSPAAQKGSR